MVNLQYGEKEYILVGLDMEQKRVPLIIDTKDTSPFFSSCFMLKQKNTYSLYREISTSCYREIARFEKVDGIYEKKFSPDIKNAFLYEGVRVMSEAYVEDEKAIEEIYGYSLYVAGFNQLCSLKNETAMRFIIKMELLYGKHFVLMPVLKPAASIIPKDVMTSMLSCPFRQQTSYIEKLDDNEYMIRIFTFYHGHMLENARIWVAEASDGKVKMRYFSFSEKGWYEEKEYDIVPKNFDFPICGADELGGHVKKCYERSENSGLRLCLSLINNALENLVEMKMEGLISLLKSKKASILALRGKDLFAEDESETVFGEIKYHDASSFAAYIGVPNYVIPILNKYPSAVSMLFCNDIKEIFLSYVKNGNKEQTEKIIKTADEISTKLYVNIVVIVPVLCHLTVLGVSLIKALENVKAIALNSDVSQDCLCLYGDYLLMLKDYKRCTGTTGEFSILIEPDNMHDINSIHDRIMDALENIKDVLDEENKKRFREVSLENKWMEYRGKTLSAIVPKESNEMIDESTELNHCVKTYCEAVMEKKTAILFIRRNDNIDKPFFTLEIRNKKVRQCHGRNNCDMTSEVRKFVEEYCKEKKFEFCNTNAALCV